MGLENGATSTTILAGMLWLCYTVASVPNTEVKLILCNIGMYFKDDPFATSLSYVLSELEAATPTRAGYDYRNISPYPNAFAYGHANCNQNLTSSDCATCLVAAETAMLSSCFSRIGARCLLHDCSMSFGTIKALAWYLFIFKMLS